MTDPNVHQTIANMRDNARMLLQRIDQLVFQACPGPHLPRQHRDGKPPWCRKCGYSQDGTRITVPS